MMMASRFKAHPWHGIEPGGKLPEEIRAFIEISPTDTVKYEIDKTSGYLKIDRPQKYSNVVPALYGFIPQTYCGDQLAGLCMAASGLEHIKGDGDPLDILVLTDRVIPRGDIIVDAIPIGGLRLLDKNEADDKIIAVLKGDYIYGSFNDLIDLPNGTVERIKHYFVTYKDMPSVNRTVEVLSVYGKEEAYSVIRAGVADYQQLVNKE
jgi:inorganic pyrophosphatase